MDRLTATLNDIDHCNAQDPHVDNDGGQSVPKELLYARRMSAWLRQLQPHASERLQIAVRAQHLERWLRPRRDYPMDRDGYKRWRTDCAAYHARRAGEIMAKHGYDQSDIDCVGAAIRKENLKTNSEAQTLEDCAALVFLAHHFDTFAAEHADYSDEKMLKIVRRTWAKMSAAGQAAAMTIAFSPVAKPWIDKALGVTS